MPARKVKRYKQPDAGRPQKISPRGGVVVKARILQPQDLAPRRFKSRQGVRRYRQPDDTNPAPQPFSPGVPVPSESVVLYAEPVPETTRPRIRVITAMRNCAPFVANCMRSLLHQRTPFRAIVIDDVSDDGTYEIARQVVGYDSRILLVRNDRRLGALANIMRGIDALRPEPNDVVVTLDGDDWFSSDDTLGYVQRTYRESPELRLTYGQFVHSASGAIGLCAPYPPHITNSRAYRNYSWLASHLRTFRAELWRRVRREDLIDPGTGQPWMMAWDMAMMFPMMEMCSPAELRCLQKVLYVYNDGNPLNDNKVNARLQQALDARIRSMPVYAVAPR
jgi:hypothetical protein